MKSVLIQILKKLDPKVKDSLFDCDDKQTAEEIRSVILEFKDGVQVKVPV